MIHSTTAASSSTSLLAVAVGTVSSESVAAFGSILADAGFAGTPPATPTLTLTVPTLSLPVTDGVRQVGAATGKALPLESAQRDISVAPIDPLVALLTPTPAAPAQTPGATANQAATATPITIPATVIAAKATASSEATPTPRLASITHKPSALKSEATPRDVPTLTKPLSRSVAKDDPVDTDQPKASPHDSVATAAPPVAPVPEIIASLPVANAIPVAGGSPSDDGTPVGRPSAVTLAAEGMPTLPQQPTAPRLMTSPLTLTSAGVLPTETLSEPESVMKGADGKTVSILPNDPATPSVPLAVAASLQTPSLLASSIEPRTARVIASSTDIRTGRENRTSRAVGFSATVASVAPSRAPRTPLAQTTPVPTATGGSPMIGASLETRTGRVIASGRDMRIPFESRTADAAAFAAAIAPAAPSPASLTPSALPTPVPTVAETLPIPAAASGVAAGRATETPPTAATTATTTPAQVFPLPDRMPEIAARATSAAAAVPTPSAPVPPAPVMQGPAMQVFGAAIAAAQRDERGRPLDQHGDATAMTPVAEAARTAIAATDTTQQAPLDLRQDRWPHSMVDRIAHLRDAAAAMSASAADTTIRLIPDALGTIDVSISRDGDAVSVRFQAEHAATRSMLQDAQGRLADIAESRGLRLSGSSVDGGSLGTGTGTSDQRTPQQPQPTLPGAPPRASTSDPLSADDADSGRVA